MSITFENGKIIIGANVGKEKAAATATTSHSGSRVKNTVGKGAFALDISGTVMDNTAYEGQGKTTEDVMRDAGQIDVATQRNYMAVMSNTMSDEDFARLQEEGYHPGSMEMETVVTIVDEIKAALAKGGQNIVGYTDDLDLETLTQITGSAGFAKELIKQFGERDIPVTKENVEDAFKACKSTMQIDGLNDGVVKYMIRNHMEPTVDNIYKAQYSAYMDADKQGKGYYQDDTGYYAKKAEDYNWQQLMPQMEKVIQDAGLEVSEETLSDAKWLIEKGVPLTEESLGSLHELRNLKLPQTMEEILSAAAAAIADGKGAGSANLSNEKTYMEKAQEYMDTVNSISGEAVDKAIAEGRFINIRNLRAAQLQISMGIRTDTFAVSISGRRQLEEVRLQMSLQANLHLLRNGFSIDTAELSKLVDALKAADTRYEQTLLGGEGADIISGRAELYRETLGKAGELSSMPAALIGRFAVFTSRSMGDMGAASSQSFTLEAVYGEGAVLRSAYEKARESYETLMMAPSAELGDSIKKAFNNIDDILREMNMEVSDANRRAVRILGYNRMEISEDNIYAVKSTDLTVKRVIEKLTPASTLQMIREGVNPLSMNMEELETYLDNQEKNPKADIEKYSKFLYKLDKNNNISPKEREAYIGIYRLFRQLDKTDGAAIGSLLNQGVEPTVENLLSAMRSNKKLGMDVKVDDSFGGVSSSYQGKSISEQIQEGYYSKLVADIFDHMNAGSMYEQFKDGSMNLEELAAMLRTAQTEHTAKDNHADADKEYRREQLSQLRETFASEDSVIKELLEFDQPVTADNLLAAGLLTKERGKMYGKIKEFADLTGDQKAFEEAVINLQENMTDEESAKEAYGNMQQTFTDIVEDMVYGHSPGDRIDIKEISNLYKQISLTSNLAKEENYEVPVNIEGEITSINLRIIHGHNESGTVTASMQTAGYGKVTARFRINDISKADKGSFTHQMSGYIVSDSKEGLALLDQSGETLRKAFEYSGIQVTGLNYIYSAETDFTAAAHQDRVNKGLDSEEGVKDRQNVSTKTLYDTAKIFISYIQKGKGF